MHLVIEVSKDVYKAPYTRQDIHLFQFQFSHNSKFILKVFIHQIFETLHFSHILKVLLQFLSTQGTHSLNCNSINRFPILHVLIGIWQMNSDSAASTTNLMKKNLFNWG